MASNVPARRRVPRLPARTRPRGKIQRRRWARRQLALHRGQAVQRTTLAIIAEGRLQACAQSMHACSCHHGGGVPEITKPWRVAAGCKSPFCHQFSLVFFEGMCAAPPLVHIPSQHGQAATCANTRLSMHHCITVNRLPCEARPSILPLEPSPLHARISLAAHWCQSASSLICDSSSLPVDSMNGAYGSAEACVCASIAASVICFGACPSLRVLLIII